MNLYEKARELMLRNRKATGGKYICPSWPHYPHRWLWDSCFHAEICAELSRHFNDPTLMEIAKNELSFLDYQKEDGFIPHIMRVKFPSTITQPPVIAQALETIGDPKWVLQQQVFPKVLKFYLYFANCRDPDADGLIYNKAPCETGSNTAPEFDLIKGRLSRPLALLTLLLRPLRRINMECLEFNCLWIQGLRILRRFSKDPETQKILKKIANKAEEALYNLCWDENDQIFYPLNSKNQKIKVVTIASLYPLILENIPKKISDALVNHLTNPKEFWTEYPIPSVPQNSSHFNCNWQYYWCCNWRGPVWINTNRHIIEGLVLHGYSEIAQRIAERTTDMVEREGFWEFYHPFTGRGMRIPNFGWSAQVILFPRILSKPF